MGMRYEDQPAAGRKYPAWSGAAAPPWQEPCQFAGFLRSIVPLANRHKVKTELIQPAGSLMDETVSDAAGNPMTYRRAELRFRIHAKYQDLGEYLGDIEALDQLVVVRSIAMQSGMPQPELAADVTIWLYGTP